MNIDIFDPEDKKTKHRIKLVKGLGCVRVVDYSQDGSSLSLIRIWDDGTIALCRARIFD